MSDPQLQAIRQLLSSTPDIAVSRPTKLQNALQAFVSLNEDASRSPNYQSQEPDDLEGLVSLLSSDAVKSHEEILLRVLKSLKILTRKYDNRVRLGEYIVEDLVEVLHMNPSPVVSGEASNVVLNICYERDNVVRLVNAGGVPPLILFAKDDSQMDLQANAAGAIQSICFQKEGRSFVREHGAIEAVLPLLGSSNLKVQTRAVGAVHNMSSEPEAIRVIRRLDGIPLLIQLLRVPSAPVCGSAAGSLQNLSRESASRTEILSLGAVVPLSDLLFGSDVQSQVCAAGAILNLLGPTLGAEDPNNRQRQGFKKLLSLALTIGMLNDALRQDQTEMEPSASKPTRT
jgi:hypothetical protein|eukprot:Transcript_19459.p1 GENE.Transcript_19459~~Transcript_19459.p1  ORF type:complete len:374 (-),score=157.08 Transcript_19459:649-1677(-)